MPRSLKTVLRLIVAMCVLFGAGWFVFDRLSAAMCGASSPVAAVPQASGRRQAVLYEYDCGATTGFATHISILPVGKSPYRPGNAFIADTDHGLAADAAWGGPWAEISWTGPEMLDIRYDAKARVFKSERQVDGVEITFVPVAR